MATETDSHPSFCNQGWYCRDLLSDNQTYEGESTILDHGSISFGRYAGELAWEKWSVFNHNRCQEEIEKFKAQGFVAQKKAYFEEYYKKIRAMKELRAQRQDSSQLGPSQGIPDGILPIELGADAAFSSEEDEDKNVAVSSVEDEDKNVSETKSYSSGSNNANPVDGARVSLNVPCEGASLHCASSVGRRSGAVQRVGLVSRKVGKNINKIGKHESLLRDEGTVASYRNKTMLSSRTTEDAVKKFVKPKPSPQMGNSSQVEKGLPLRKGITQIVAGSINRQMTDARSTLRASSARGKLVLSASSVRDVKAKTSANFHCSGNNLKTRLPVSCSSPKGISKEATVTDSLKDMTPNMRLTVRKSKHLPDRGKSNQSVGVMGHNSLDKEAQGQKGKGNNDATIKRDSNILTSSYKASTPKMDHKILPRRSADLTHAQRKQRERKPVWR